MAHLGDCLMQSEKLQKLRALTCHDGVNVMLCFMCSVKIRECHALQRLKFGV